VRKVPAAKSRGLGVRVVEGAFVEDFLVETCSSWVRWKVLLEERVSKCGDGTVSSLWVS
jgi:hypothetical protein